MHDENANVVNFWASFELFQNKTESLSIYLPKPSAMGR